MQSFASLSDLERWIWSTDILGSVVAKCDQYDLGKVVIAPNKSWDLYELDYAHLDVEDARFDSAS